MLSLGKILAYSGMMQDMEVSWFPSYGPEMRGGTANVTVILSNDRVSSPVLNEYDTAILLNQQSIDKFESRVKEGGLLIYDGNGVTTHPSRKDLQIWRIDAADEATRMSTTRTFNMIVLGGYLKIKPVVKLENVLAGLKKSLPKRYHHLIPVNEEAVKRGMEIIHQVA